MRITLWRLVVLIILSVIVAASDAVAQDWSDFATVSMTNATTPKLTANRLCYTDGRDMLCDGAAGLLTTSGTLAISNISVTNLTVGGVAITGGASGDRITSGTLSAIANASGGYISLTTGNTTWGYLGSSATYLPLVSGTYHYGQYASYTALTVGGVAITGAGASSMASLTDVSETGVSSGMLLRYNGTKWESVGASTALSTTTIEINFPDAILCNSGTSNVYLYLQNRVVGGSVVYRTIYNNLGDIYVMYTAAGAYSSNSGLGSYDCTSLTISQLYARGQAYNFIGSSLQSAVGTNTIQYSNNGVMAAATGLTYNSATSVVSLTGTISATNAYGQNASFTTLYVGGVAVTGGSSGDRITSGTASIIANSTGGYISLTTGNTTWGYLGSSATYLPKVSTVNVSATSGIQVGTMSATCASGISGTIRYNTTSNTMDYCNGAAWTSMGPSLTTVAFRARRTSAQSLTASTFTKVNWDTEDFDNASAFSSGTFTAPTAGTYVVTAGVLFYGTTFTGAELYIYRNGSTACSSSNNASASQVSPNVACVLSLSAGDTLEVYAWTSASGGQIYNSYNQFSVSMITSGGAGGGGSTSPGGNTTNVQYNSGGNFSGSDNLAWDNSNRNLQVSGSMQYGGTGSEACSSAADYGKNRRNPTSGRMQVCLFR